MRQVEDIKVLNIDSIPYAVDSMSTEVKDLVDTYNNWNQDLSDAHKRFSQLSAATQQLSNQIVAVVRKEKADVETEAAAKGEGREATGDPVPADITGNNTEDK
jgi:uncharacterized protein YoxC